VGIMELKEIHTRAYNRFNLDEFEGTITKYSNTIRMRNEIEYYRSIPDDLKRWFPRVFNSDTSKGQDAWIELEYYNYRTLGDVLTKEKYWMPPEMWKKVLIKLRTILAEWWAYKPQHVGWPSQIDTFASEMYINKTEREFENLKKDLGKKYSKLFSKKKLLINGVEFDNFPIIWNDVKEYIEEVIVPDTSVCFIHGDCCFSNILYAADERIMNLRFIDPRGSFGARGVWGDPRYDVAKLMHSADGGYEFLNNDQFQLHLQPQNFDAEYYFIDGDTTETSVVFDNVFFEEDHRFDRQQIMMIQGLLYISMAARHYENEYRQVVQYLIGVELLNESMSL